MRIAITIWGTRISPVFHAAQNLLIVDWKGAEIVDRQDIPFDPRRLSRVLALLRERGIGVLICGALCEREAEVLETHGVRVVSFVTGEADQVVERYVRGRDLRPFSLPGCRWGRCRRSGGAASNFYNEEEVCRDEISRVREDRGRENGGDSVAVPPRARRKRAGNRPAPDPGRSVAARGEGCAEAPAAKGMEKGDAC